MNYSRLAGFFHTTGQSQDPATCCLLNAVSLIGILGKVSQNREWGKQRGETWHHCNPPTPTFQCFSTKHSRIVTILPLLLPYLRYLVDEYITI